MEQNNVTSGPNQMGFIGRIIGVFTSPGNTFLSIQAKPAWLIPAIILLILTVAFVFIAKPIILTESAEQQQIAMEKRGMSQEQIETATEKRYLYGELHIDF
jgi:hypothetical protein